MAMQTEIPTGTRGHRRLRWLFIVAGILATMGIAIWAWSLPVRPDPFLLPAAGDLDASPGTLLRSQAFTHGIPANARGWRIVYATTDGGGGARLGSALVLRPRVASNAPRPVVAWAHGTTGIATGCAPSLLEDPFANTPALAQAIAAGWTVVATDYAGLGTPGVHGYLIGEDEARSTLDAVRAARGLRDAMPSDTFVLWGHSQGGHAALWSAARAPAYAPELRLAGVAALAPASDLPALVRHAQREPVGKIISSFIVTAYAARYPELDADALLRPGARWLARDMARRCLTGTRTLVSVGESLLLRDAIFAGDPTTGTLGARLRENSADIAIAAPVLIAQGDRDELVLPAVQAAYVERRCKAGQLIAYRLYPGRDHLSLVASGSPMEADLIDWTRARFAGEPVGQACIAMPN
jgi:pimeloyl-ACP methyl ester carboxylesterase